MGSQKVRSVLAGISKQALRYVLVAGTTAIAYLALVAIGLAAGLHYMLAILLAQMVTILGAFPFYRHFVFQSRSRIAVDFIRFLTVWSSGMVAGLIVTPLLVELLGLGPLFAQTVAIVAVSVLSFLGHRFFSFRPARSHRDDTDE